MTHQSVLARNLSHPHLSYDNERPIPLKLSYIKITVKVFERKMSGKIDTFSERGRSKVITGSRDCRTSIMGVLVAAVVIFNILAPVR